MHVTYAYLCINIYAYIYIYIYAEIISIIVPRAMSCSVILTAMVRLSLSRASVYMSFMERRESWCSLCIAAIWSRRDTTASAFTAEG